MSPHRHNPPKHNVNTIMRSFCRMYVRLAAFISRSVSHLHFVKSGLHSIATNSGFVEACFYKIDNILFTNKRGSRRCQFIVSGGESSTAYKRIGQDRGAKARHKAPSCPCARQSGARQDDTVAKTRRQAAYKSPAIHCEMSISSAIVIPAPGSSFAPTQTLLNGWRGMSPTAGGVSGQTWTRAACDRKKAVNGGDPQCRPDQADRNYLVDCWKSSPD